MTIFIIECLKIANPSQKMIYGVILLINHKFGETKSKTTNPKFYEVLGEKGIIAFNKVFGNNNNIDQRETLFKYTKEIRQIWPKMIGFSIKDSLKEDAIPEVLIPALQKVKLEL